MLIQWILIVAAAAAAGVAAVRARRIAKRLDRLRESYWDLRYEFGQLQARVTRLEADRAEPANPPAPKTGGGGDTFVPLSSLKR